MKDIVVRLNDEFDFTTIIHPNLRISKYIEIGQGTIIYPGVILTVNTKIGNHVVISGFDVVGEDVL